MTEWAFLIPTLCFVLLGAYVFRLDERLRQLDNRARGHAHAIDARNLPEHWHDDRYARTEHPHDYAEATHGHSDRGMEHAHSLAPEGEMFIGPRGFQTVKFRCDVPGCEYKIVIEWPH